jgi:hypothetical protein
MVRKRFQSPTALAAGNVVASFAPPMLTSPQLHNVEMAHALPVMLRVDNSDGLIYRLQ